MAAEPKTKPTDVSVDAFIDKIADEVTRDSCHELIKIMHRATGEKPRLWGPSIVGFGSYHYKYESGHEGDSCLTGFAPRKGKISLYVTPGFDGHAELLEKLGKFKAAKGCIYIKKAEDIDAKVLETLVKKSVARLKKKYA